MPLFFFLEYYYISVSWSELVVKHQSLDDEVETRLKMELDFSNGSSSPNTCNLFTFDYLSISIQWHQNHNSQNQAKDLAFFCCPRQLNNVLEIILQTMLWEPGGWHTRYHVPGNQEYFCFY